VKIQLKKKVSNSTTVELSREKINNSNYIELKGFIKIHIYNSIYLNTLLHLHTNALYVFIYPIRAGIRERRATNYFSSASTVSVIFLICLFGPVKICSKTPRRRNKGLQCASSSAPN
jgi:hypothetical protein